MLRALVLWKGLAVLDACGRALDDDDYNVGGTEYSYDAEGQLTQVDCPAGNTDTFTYDDNGNRTQWARSSDATISYIYNNADQLTQSTEGTIGTSYSHDNNGNLIARVDKTTSDSTEYIYNYSNRLIGVNEYTGGVTLTMEAEYRYDGLNRRIAKIVNNDTTVYIYDGGEFIREYDGSQILVASYTYEPGIDKPLEVTRNSSDYYFHRDKLGSVRTLTDNAGIVAQAYKYDSFGNI